MGANALLAKLNDAVRAVNEAEKFVTTAQAELVSRSKAVGMLLLEAKKLHPRVKEFEAFLARVDGLKLSRAYDLLRLAGGRTTDEELRKDARERKQKSREKKKKEKEDSVTVTETEPELVPQWIGDARRSSHALAQFTYACKHWLPQITVEADRNAARNLILEWEKANRKGKRTQTEEAA